MKMHVYSIVPYQFECSAINDLIWFDLREEIKKMMSNKGDRTVTEGTLSDRALLAGYPRQMDHTNQDAIGENCVRNDPGERALTDEDKMMA